LQYGGFVVVEQMEAEMRRLTLLMKDEEKAALDELARREFRDPRDQLRLILCEEARRHGLLPADDTARPAQLQEPLRVAR
jgi:hypothetical protein